MKLRLAFIAAVAALTSVAALAGPSSVASAGPVAGGLWHAPVVVTHDAAPSPGDTASVIAISCAAAGDCSAVGHYSGTLAPGGTHTNEGFVVDETGGSWGTAREVASDNNGAYQFSDISCPSAGNCVAVGGHGGSSGHGFVMDETNGTWGAPQVIADALTSVSCPAPGHCTAVGTQGYGGMAVVVAQTGGTWGAPQVLPGSLNVDAGLTSVSCPSVGNCAAGGYYDAQPHGPLPDVGYVLIADERAGTWQPVHTVTGSFTANRDIDVDRVTSVSCSSAGNCSAAGYDATYQGESHAFVVSEVANSWQKAVDVGGALAVGGAQLSSISCPRNGDCAAVGFYLDRNADNRALVVDETGGRWHAAQQVAAALNVGAHAQLTSVACVAVGACNAAGFYTNSSGGFVGLVVDQTAGAWGPGEAVATSPIADGLSQVNMISCPSAGNCTAGGVIDDAKGYEVGFVVGETPASVPGPPRHVRAVAGVSKARVSWSRPGTTGSAPITGYTVTATPGGRGCRTASTSCTVAGLVDGTRYHFRVVADNRVGASAPSVSNAVVPQGPPGAPTIVGVSHSRTSVTVRWKPPSSNGGRPVTGYEVYVARAGGPFRLANHRPLAAARRAYQVGGLTGSTRYHFIVRARNRLGLGPPSNSVTAAA